jgi:hypothetical protein
MPRGRIDMQKVLASLNKFCPKCGHQITPAEIKRVSWEEIAQRAASGSTRLRRSAESSHPHKT